MFKSAVLVTVFYKSKIESSTAKKIGERKGDFMLNFEDIRNVFGALQALKLECRFGYAGSYARGQAKENSDLDILVEGADILSSDAYFKIYNTLKKTLTIKFDIVDLKALQQDDYIMDKKLLEIGLAVNDCSAYKTIREEAIWIN